MMKIRDNRWVKFSELTSGDAFLLPVGERYCIKVSHYRFPDLTQNLYVDMLSGELEYICPDKRVIPLKSGEMHIH